MILTITPNPCVDKTIYVDSLEPGTFIRAAKYSCIPGGKGVNVARAVKILGGEATAVVVVGGHTGRHAVEMIKSERIRCRPVWVESPTRTITTVLEERIHRQTALFEPGSEIGREEYRGIVERCSLLARRASVVCYSGTVSHANALSLYRDLLPRAKRSGAKTILDSHGAEFALGIEKTPFMIKPNEQEASELLGVAIATDTERWDAVARFHDKGIELVVLSAGARGAFISDGATRLIVRPPQIKEVNAVGSGDALVAAFALGLDQGWSLEKMARYGAAAGAANARVWDIGRFTLEDVEELAGAVEVRAVP
ncbi:MAG: hexose kinase [Candidatus Hydrogenedentota bacterium]